MPEQFDIAKFGRRLKHLRTEILHMGSKKFAAQAGVSFGMISQYENGKRGPSGQVLFAICKAYGVSADWLLGLSEG